MAFFSPHALRGCGWPFEACSWTFLPNRSVRATVVSTPTSADIPREASVHTMASKYEDDDAEYAEEHLDESDPLFWLQSLPGGGEEWSVFIKAAEWWHQEHPKWFNEFADQHCYLFDNLPLQTADKMECPLECTEIHNRFMEEYEEMLEDFIVEEGSSYEEFVEEAGKMLGGTQLSIIETTEHTDFLKTLMSSIEYKNFHNLLVNAARRKKYGDKKNKKGKRPSRRKYSDEYEDEADDIRNGSGSSKK